VSHDLAPGCFGVWVEIEHVNQLGNNLFVVLGLIEVLFLFLLQRVVLDAPKRCRVDGNSALLGLERFVEKFREPAPV
jgi:hypothetical protein